MHTVKSHQRNLPNSIPFPFDHIYNLISLTDLANTGQRQRDGERQDTTVYKKTGKKKKERHQGKISRDTDRPGPSVTNSGKY